MRVIIILACALAVVMAHDRDDLVVNTREWAEKCGASLNITPERLEEMHKNKLPPTEKPETCLLACIFEKSGIMESKKLKKDGIDNLSKSILTGEPEKLEAAMKVNEDCYEQAKDKSDECEIASTFGKCVHDHMGDIKENV